MRKNPILHLPEYGHMLSHVHVVRRHIDNVLESTPCRLQHHAQVLPARQELRFGIRDHCKVNGTPHLSSAENGGAKPYRGYIAGTVYDTLHRSRDDQFSVCHLFIRKCGNARPSGQDCMPRQCSD
ncbi:hypothetical protein CT19425_U350048 [Cupriavidus taiwanensis]|uniref:Uncharacterized protein n=1 Tax=Cupriavidus taiwanensis TaxID=164546 RepID=A0A375I7K5_9BURK|nr:hypothetical protein CT19425_U350048 [Cupriavidus taiwanensis]